jgi:photosynthetic reaction center cytochrome c subunit
MMRNLVSKFLALALVTPALLLGGCEFGTKIVSQGGPNGTAVMQVSDKSSAPRVGVVPDPPYPLTPDMLTGPRASETYQNVQVLGDLSTEEFNYTMASLTNWVAPDDGTVKNGGCAYCHNVENMASDALYTKVVARKMLQMTRAINTQWKPHFALSVNASAGNAGVTCWTCHRGKPVPAYNWSSALPSPNKLVGKKYGQDTPGVSSIAYASLPYDPFTSYLQGKENIRVGSAKPLPSDHVVSIGSTEKSYALMMHMSTALGVNCTYCHNTQGFGDWSHSSKQRVSAWYGIRMVRDINNNYITSLMGVWPANRLGPAGDPKKVFCATCHQQINKPLGGYPMLKDYPGLKGSYDTAVPVAAAAAAPEAPPMAPIPVASAAPAAGVAPVATATQVAKPAV